MRAKFICGLILLASSLLLPASSSAQFTLVSGTVTDPNGIVYANGTINATLITPGGGPGATLNGASFNQYPGPFQMDGTGSFIFRLPDNNVVQPPGTQWKFTVNIAPGILPPAGTGPQSFSVTLTITGSIQSITSNLNALAPKLANGLGGSFGGSVTPGQFVYAAVGTNQLASTPNYIWNQGTLTQTLTQTTAATGGANQSSPSQCFSSNYWTGAASAPDLLCWQAVPAAGSNPNIALNLTHAGSPGGFTFTLPANIFQVGPTQLCNTALTVCQLFQVGASTGNSLQWPLATPANGNMFLASFSTGNPVQLGWRNAPWSGAPIDLTGQNAAIGTTTWASSNLFIGAGQYRVTWDAKVTTAAGTSSTLGPLTITYVDPDGTTQTITAAAQSKAGAIETTDTGNTTTTVLLGVPFLMNVNNALNNITYAFGYASNAANAMVYNLHLRLEAIQ
jgi:hypothetical protein